jgi:hypothetical protein
MLAAACTLDRGGSARDGDAGKEQRGSTGDDAGVDAGGDRDTGPPDAGAPDAGAPDAGAPDAGEPDAGRRTCDAIYSGMDSYDLCAETESECEFYARLGDRTCQAVCEGFGASCRDSWEDASDGCERLSESAGCMESHGDAICSCTRP